MDLKNVLLAIGGTFLGACVGEAVFMGSRGLKADCEAVGDYGKELLDPTPVLIKQETKSFGPIKFYEKRTVRRSKIPFNNTAVPYEGSKPAINKKPVKVGKGPVFLH